jgi:hypothetical protein
VNAYPLCEAQRVTTTLIGEQAAQPSPKRTAREIAEERLGQKEKANDVGTTIKLRPVLAPDGPGLNLNPTP